MMRHYHSYKLSIPSGESGLHLCPTNQREHHRLVLAHGHIIHQAAPERFVEFRNRLGQLFQFRDEPLEFPPADTPLPDVSRHLFALRLGGFVSADRGIVLLSDNSCSINSKSVFTMDSLSGIIVLGIISSVNNQKTELRKKRVSYPHPRYNDLIAGIWHRWLNCI